MKQKRKVKSLISSNGENKNLLTTLLFLAGGVLLFGALALIASIGGVASAESSDVIEYPGIDDKKEVLLRFGLIPEGGNTAVNEMFLTGKTFFVNGSAGLSVDDTAGMSLGAGKYINFLGGRPDGANIDSNNVTIIGGSQAKILENNDNTTFLGGNSNTVNPGTNSVSPVMLGGQNNIIGSNQEGSAIIGGRNNEIGGSASYDFILGGENNNIESNSKNAIVGGARVTVDGGKSNLFAFSAEGTEFKPQGSNAFYLNVQHGLGLNKAASNLSENNLGIDSNGAVSFGPIDITSSARKCTASDVGVQGSWEGCLVGCTKLGADNGGKWEMVDHGDKCKRLCELNSAYCMMSPIEPAKPDPYTSYCTTNGVDTGHSHHCGGEALILPNYQNVLFETMLIDSDDSCPKPGTSNWTENRCVFKCDGEYHLTGDKTGMGGRTKCYKDCKLPWDGTKIKHNETRIAYNTDETYCAFPSGSPASPHTCANHKATIICQNGTLYVQKSNGQADTTKPAITNGYVYSGCMLNQYRCNTDVYNYTASDITNTSKFNDKVTTWNLTDRGQTNGVRGKYKLCIDYNTNPNTVQQLNGEKCDALNLNTSLSPKRYTTHYQWVGCQANYHTGAGYENVCMKDCTLKKTNNQTQYYRHNTTVVGYKTKEKTCTDKCEFTTLVCNDGEWRLGSLNGTKTTAYVYNDCTLKDYTCASRYNVTETEKQAHESTSIYGNSCVPYKANNTDKVTCTAQSTKYELTDCKSGYHTVNGKRCVSNNKQVNCNTTNVDRPPNSSFNVVLVWVSWKSSCGRKGNDATCWDSPVDCDWYCNTNYHQEGSFLCCHDGEHSDGGTCTSNTSSAQCIEAGGVENSHYIIENVPITYNESNGTWSTPRNCNWECDTGYTENGGKCDKDPDPIVGNCGTDPVHYTCVSGTADDKTSTDDKYTWTCKGSNGGGDDYCTELRSGMGWCKATHYGCYAGSSENNNETDDKYTWTCRGRNGGDDADCVENKTPINGLCADLKDECINGEFEDISDTTTDYKWNCVGSNGGTTDNCSIDKCEAKGCYRTDQECNEANGHSGPGTICYTDDDQCYCHGTINGICSTTLDECEVGIYEDVDDTSTQFKRDCLGSNGGADAHCSKSCPTGQTIQNGVCKSSTITINICPYVVYNHGVNGQCYTNETLDDVVYVATTPLPTDVSITAGFTYKSWKGQSNGGNPVCQYSSGSKSTVYTISAGNTESVAPSGGHSDALHTYDTAYSATVGYKSYFETSFTSSINKTSYTSSTGQEYNIVLYTAPCGVSYRDQDPECGGMHYNCAVGTPGATNEGSTSYTWTCTNGGSSVDCSEPRSKMGQCGSTHYSCIDGTSTNNNEGTNKWTWTCEGINGGDDADCSESCPEGQIIQNHQCVSENYVRVCAGECSVGASAGTPSANCSNLSQSQCNNTEGCAWNTLDRYCYVSGPEMNYDCLDKTKTQCSNISACSWSEEIRCVKDTTYCKNQAATSLDLTADCVDTSNSKCSGNPPVCDTNDIPVSEEPECGAASNYATSYPNGYFIAPPDSDLCDIGTASAPRHYPMSSPSWTRTCKIGSTTKSCTARYALAGSCGDSENTCNAGNKQNYNSSTHTRECAGGYGGTAYCGCNFNSCPLGYTYSSTDNKCHLDAKACLRFSEVSFGSPGVPDGDAGEIVTTSYCSDGYTEQQYGLASTITNDALCSVSYPYGLNVFNGGSCYDIEDALYYEDGDAPGGTTCDTGIFGGRNPNGLDPTIPLGCYLRNIGNQWDGIYEYVCGSSDSVIDPCTGVGGSVCNVTTLSIGI